MKLSEFKNKKILILGLGREGLASFLFLRKFFPEKILGLADKLEFEGLNFKLKKKLKQDENIKLHLGKNYLESIKDYDVVIKSPGIPLKTIQPYLSKKTAVTSQTEIFFDNCPGKIIGVTGTKGKSTVSTLIYRVLKSGGVLDIHLIGNIGKPAISFLKRARKTSVFVYELSSHQLMGLKKSPNIAVVLSIFPEHLDYYKNFKEYVTAKSNIARWQKKRDILIFKRENKLAKKVAGKSPAKKYIFGVKKGKLPGCYIEKEIVYYSESGRREKILKNSEIKLPGIFNVLNAMPAIIVGKILNIPSSKIVSAIKNFKGLPHRLEFIGEHRGVKFFNDSLATIPEATIEALDSLRGNVDTMILGGFDRGLNFKNLAKKIIKSRAKTLIFFPTTGVRIWKEVHPHTRTKTGFADLGASGTLSLFGVGVKTQKKSRPGIGEKSEEIRHFFVENMKDAVALAYRHTKKGGVCLLSCASPSFGLFKDYEERGNLFKYYVKFLGVVK